MKTIRYTEGTGGSTEATETILFEPYYSVISVSPLVPSV
jgi:hypothetical protein